MSAMFLMVSVALIGIISTFILGKVQVASFILGKAQVVSAFIE